MKNSEKETNKNVKIGIYKITNPSGKVYIGQSTDIEGRWKRNYYSLNCKEQIKLYRSLKKHKPENHIFETIEECSELLLEEREIYWGKFYEVLNPKKGLNLRLGNMRGSWGEEVRNKMSKSHLGKKFTKEHCKNISKNKKGFKYSKERSEKIRKKLKGIPRPDFQRSISQYDLEDNLLNKFNSMKEAANFLNLKHINGIEACCRGVIKTSSGYKWKYSNEKN